MSSSRKYTEELMTEAIRQVAERGFAVKEVVAWLVVSNRSFCRGSRATARRPRDAWHGKIKWLEAELDSS